MVDYTSIPDHVQKKSIIDYTNDERFQRFVQDVSTITNGDLRFASFSFPVPSFDPLACLEHLGLKREFQFYWEKPDRQFALSAGETLTELTASGHKRFRRVAEQVSKLKKAVKSYSHVEHSFSGIHLLGGFSFFDQIKDSEWKSFGSASFILPTWLFIREGKFGLLTISIKIEENYGAQSITGKVKQQLGRFERVYRLLEKKKQNRKSSGLLSSLESKQSLKEIDEKWSDSVNRAKRLIGNKKFEKIVLARKIDWHAERPIVPTHIVNTLRSEYPSCYNYLIQKSDGKAFLGCSPERLVSYKKNYILTESLAGSISRGATASEDAYLEKKLSASDKNLSEHYYVLTAIADRLRPFSKKIEAAKQPDIRKLKNVQHLFTPVTAWLNNGAERFSILNELHPTPAVGGYPREQAVPYIKELEQFDRGWYAGPVGWFNLRDGGEFAVAIRSGLINGTLATLFAGCGIVKDSEPQAEWEETNLKLIPMLSAVQQNGVRTEE